MCFDCVALVDLERERDRTSRFLLLQWSKYHARER